MNLTNHFLKYYNHLDSEFHYWFSEMLTDFGEEAIHGLRVNIKKQYAFFQLLKELDESFDAEAVFNSLNKIFKKAGEVRDLQVGETLLQSLKDEIDISPKIIKRLHRKEVKQEKKLQKVEGRLTKTPMREGSRKVRNSIHHLTPEKVCLKAPQYFERLMKTLLQLGEQPVSTKNLHRFRILIKEFFYNLQFIDECTSSKTWDISTIDKLDEFEELLGKWHDYEVTIKSLSKKEKGNVLLENLKHKRKISRKKIGVTLTKLPTLFAHIEKELPGMMRTMSEECQVSEKPSYVQKNLWNRLT